MTIKPLELLVLLLFAGFSIYWILQQCLVVWKILRLPDESYECEELKTKDESREEKE